MVLGKTESVGTSTSKGFWIDRLGAIRQTLSHARVNVAHGIVAKCNRTFCVFWMFVARPACVRLAFVKKNVGVYPLGTAGRSDLSGINRQELGAIVRALRTDGRTISVFVKSGNVIHVAFLE